MDNSVGCTVTGHSLVRLHIDGLEMFTQQPHPAEAGDSEWREGAVREGKVLGDQRGLPWNSQTTGSAWTSPPTWAHLHTGYVPFLS